MEDNDIHNSYFLERKMSLEISFKPSFQALGDVLDPPSCAPNHMCSSFLLFCQILFYSFPSTVLLPLADDYFLRLALWSCPSLLKRTTPFLICASNSCSCLSVLSFIVIFILLMNPSLLSPACCFGSGERNLETKSRVISLLWEQAELGSTVARSKRSSSETSLL